MDKYNKVLPYVKSFTKRLNFSKDLFSMDHLSLSNSLHIESSDKKKNIILQDSDILFRYKVHPGTLNYWGAMHGGSIATLIDISTTIAITAMDKGNRKNVSIELSTDYISPIRPENDVFVLCKLGKVGKTIAYTTCELYQSNNLSLLATGSHTKAMLEEKWTIENEDNSHGKHHANHNKKEH